MYNKACDRARCACLLVMVFVTAQLVAVSSVQANVKPKVVSVNLCADQLVMLLAEPEQILSLSELSQDKAGSYLYEQATHFNVNSGSSEQILALNPDVVIAGEYTAKNATRLLRELGVRVEIIPIANTFEQLYSNIENVAKWLGHPEKAVVMTGELRARVAELVANQKAIDDKRPKAAYFDPNGYTVGIKTLRGQVLHLAGWHNIASDREIMHYGSMSLESLIQLAPDAIIHSPYSKDTYSRGQQMLEHPAIRAAGLDPHVIDIPSRQTICAGPWTLSMLEHLVQEHDKILSIQ